jgi:hypothetical protein
MRATFDVATTRHPIDADELETIMRRTTRIALTLMALAGASVASTATGIATASTPNSHVAARSGCVAHWTSWQTYRTTTSSAFLTEYQVRYYFPAGPGPACHSTQTQYRTVVISLH